MIFCSLYSGSSGNSIFISSQHTKILIDVGLSGKSIEKALTKIGESPHQIDAIFVTHEHIDHIKGAGVLSRRYNIPIYANNKTWEAISYSVGAISDHNIKIIHKSTVGIKDMDVVNYPLSHDATAPIGYAVYSEGKKVTISTDMGCFTKEVKKNIEDADVMLFESNHDVEMLKTGPYPYDLKRRILSDFGHLSNEDCGKALVEIFQEKPVKIILGHLSKTNNIPALAFKTVANTLKRNKIELNKDIFLSVADRYEPSNYIKM